MFAEPAVDLTRAYGSKGHYDKFRSRVRGLPEFGNELPVAALAEEVLTEGAGRIRALLTFAGNPVLSTPNGRQLDRALAGLDFMVSIDPYLNETTRHAHLILPPASPLERAPPAARCRPRRTRSRRATCPAGVRTRASAATSRSSRTLR